MCEAFDVNVSRYSFRYQVTRLEGESAAASSSLAKESSRVEEVERKLRDTEETLQLKTAQLR